MHTPVNIYSYRGFGVFQSCCRSAVPGLLKRNPVNSVNQIDTIRWYSELYDYPRFAKVGCRIYSGNVLLPKLQEGIVEATAICRRPFLVEIYVASKSGMAVVDDRFSANEEISYLMLVETP